MTIEITGYTIENAEVHIYARDISEEHQIMIEQGRFDDMSTDIEYVFFHKNGKSLRNWLCQQKVIRDTQPKTWLTALDCIIGIHTQSPSSCYRVFEDELIWVSNDSAMTYRDMIINREKTATDRAFAAITYDLHQQMKKYQKGK